MIKVIIFDFDGVISESVGVKAKGFEMLYKPFGDNIVSKVLSHHFDNGGVSRYEKLYYYHEKFLKSKLTDDELNELSQRFSDFVVSKIIEAPYVKGAIEFLKSNYSNFDFFISTGTPKKEIDVILNSKNINHYFKDVFGSPEKKILHIKKIIEKNNYIKNDIIFIGDSIQDKIAAVDQKITFVGRIEGNNKQLINEKYLIDDLLGLEELLLSLNKTSF